MALSRTLDRLFALRPRQFPLPPPSLLFRNASSHPSATSPSSQATKHSPAVSLPSFGSYSANKHFANGSRRLAFAPNQILKPSDLKPINLVHPADRHPRNPRPVLRRPPNKAEARVTDPFLYYKLNILNEPYNPELLSTFLTPLGRIKKRVHTGLCKKNQRRVAKAIRRARSMGFLPYFGKPLERYSDENHQRRDSPGVDLPPFAR